MKRKYGKNRYTNMLEGDNQKFTEYEKELWQFENKWIYKRTFFKKMGKLI